MLEWGAFGWNQELWDELYVGAILGVSQLMAWQAMAYIGTMVRAGPQNVPM